MVVIVRIVEHVLRKMKGVLLHLRRLSFVFVSLGLFELILVPLVSLHLLDGMDMDWEREQKMSLLLLI